MTANNSVIRGLMASCPFPIDLTANPAIAVTRREPIKRRTSRTHVKKVRETRVIVNESGLQLPKTAARLSPDQRGLHASLKNGAAVAGHPQHFRPYDHLLPVRGEQHSTPWIRYPETSGHAVDPILA